MPRACCWPTTAPARTIATKRKPPVRVCSPPPVPPCSEPATSPVTSSNARSGARSRCHWSRPHTEVEQAPPSAPWSRSPTARPPRAWCRPPSRRPPGLPPRLALAELESSRARLARAEVRALRAQISPHFIYNALTAIASFVRTDPERARELILEFAEFTRYSLPGARRVHHARRGTALDRPVPDHRAGPVRRPAAGAPADRARGAAGRPCRSCACSRWWRTRSGTACPRKPASARVAIVARDAGAECLITVEDDGVGMDPARSARPVPATRTPAHVGLANVDERLRSAFGDEFGLVVETALGAGTKVSMRVPKFRPGVRPSQPAAPPQRRHPVCESRHEQRFLRVLAVDDEPPALDELAYLLRADPRVATVSYCRRRGRRVPGAARHRRRRGVPRHPHARPGRHGAGPGARRGSRSRRRSCSSTAYDDRAAEAFDLGVVDYVRKPVQAERIAESLRRVLAARLLPDHPAVAARRERDDDPTIPVELAGTTRMLPRSAVQLGRGAGRLRPAAHRRRLAPGPDLAGDAGRALGRRRLRPHPPLVPGAAARCIGELRLTGTGYVVVVGGRELPVSRRHTRELKDRLVRAAKQQWSR